MFQKTVNPAVMLHLVVHFYGSPVKYKLSKELWKTHTEASCS